MNLHSMSSKSVMLHIMQWKHCEHYLKEQGFALQNVKKKKSHYAAQN